MLSVHPCSVAGILSDAQAVGSRLLTPSGLRTESVSASSPLGRVRGGGVAADRCTAGAQPLGRLPCDAPSGSGGIACR